MPSSNGRNHIFRHPKNRYNFAKIPFETGDEFDPDGTTSDDISSIKYVKNFLADRLSFPPETKEYKFNFDDLQDVEELGSGSFGTVRKMNHIPSGTEMAVKRVRIVNNGSDEAFNKSMQRFRKEVEAMKAASNCGEIVTFFGITFSEGDAWMCMELMDLSLEKLYTISHNIAKVNFNEATLGSVAVATIRALEHLKNDHHIIHRDIKPSNILLSRDGSIKLCDFGICGYLQDSVAQSRDVGCRPYMAPEKLVPNNEGYDIKSDVWSLGISMVEVANGQFPYAGLTEAPIFQQIQMIVYGDPPMLNSECKFSFPMITFVMACTVKDRASRADFQYLKNTEIFRKYSTDEFKEEVGQFVLKMYNLKERLEPPKA